jgi:hypothetical protein
LTPWTLESLDLPYEFARKRQSIQNELLDHVQDLQRPMFVG